MASGLLGDTLDWKPFSWPRLRSLQGWALVLLLGRYDGVEATHAVVARAGRSRASLEVLDPLGPELRGHNPNAYLERQARGWSIDHHRYDVIAVQMLLVSTQKKRKLR